MLVLRPPSLTHAAARDERAGEGEGPRSVPPATEEREKEVGLGYVVFI